VTGPRAHQFRKHSLRVIEHSDLAPPFARLRFLLVLFVVTGIFYLCWQLVVAAVTRSEGPYALRIALIVMVFYACFSIAAGASYWTHYLQQLVPVLALGAALASRRTYRWLGGHAAATCAALASKAAAMLGIVFALTGHGVNAWGQRRWRLPAHRFGPRDSIMLAYGVPERDPDVRAHHAVPVLLEPADQGSGPDLTEYVRVLDGRQAPIWLVEVGEFDWWGIDTRQFQYARATRYRVVARVGGHDIDSRDGLTRRLPPRPPC
jgi:hypothetical protein